MSDRRLSCQSTVESAAPDDANPRIAVECDNTDNARLSTQKQMALSADEDLPFTALHVNRNTRPAIANAPPPPPQNVLSHVVGVGAEGEHGASMPIQKKPALLIETALAEDQIHVWGGTRGEAGNNGEKRGVGKEGQQGNNAFHQTLSCLASADRDVQLEEAADPAVSQSPPPPPAQLTSRPRRKKRRALPGDTSSSKRGFCVEAFLRFKKTVWAHIYSPSVSTFTGLMTAVSVFVSIAIMLGTVGIISSSSSSPFMSSSSSFPRTLGGSLGSDFFPNSSSVAWERSVKLRAVGVAALKPLEDALRGLDEVQHFAMQRRETELLLDVIGNGGWTELKHTQPSRIYAPTADASALLPLGPFVSKLSSQILSNLHSRANDRSAPSIKSTNNLLHLSLGFEDGRYVHVGSVSQFRLQHDLVVSVLDGNVKSTALSGDYNGTFPLVNESLDSAAATNAVPIVNARPTDLGNATRQYYSYGSWNVSPDEGTAQEVQSSPWVNRPYIVDVASMSAVHMNQANNWLNERLLRSNVAFARNSQWYASARDHDGMAPLQKTVFGRNELGSISGDQDKYTLTFAAPVYIRRTSLFNTTVDDPADPVGGHQRSQVTYSSPSAGPAIESVITKRYLFVGVAAAHLVLEGLSDHFADVVGTVWSSTIGPSAPNVQLFLLRRDIVWATSLRQEDGTRTPVYTTRLPTVSRLVDEDGVSLCTGSRGAYTCMHSIHTFGSDLLSRAHTVLPTIANPPPLLVSDKKGSAADRVSDFMQSSSTTELVMSNDLDEAVTFSDSKGAAWDVSYAIVSQPSTEIRPFAGPQTAPFVLVLLASAEDPADCKEVLGLNLRLLVSVGVGILVVAAAVMMFVSRVVLSPLRSIATQMSMSAHLIDNSIESCTLDEKVKQKLDRTLSRWAEVSAIQRAYWSMGEELQLLAAYIPEHLRNELLAMKAGGQQRTSAQATTTEVCRQEASQEVWSSEVNSVGSRPPFSPVSSACEDVDETGHQRRDRTISPPSKCGCSNILKGPPPQTRLTEEALQVASSKPKRKASPQSQSAGSELSVGGRGLAVHSIVSLGIVFESLQDTATEGSVYTSEASASPDLPRPVFFIDSALIDREITVVHFNLLHFHWHAADTHGSKLTRHYDEFISFVHQEARRHGGMLESFSGDKIWVSFNASSKCTNGPVAAAYYAHTVTTAVNNEVILKGATKSKVFDHPIFTSTRRLTRALKIAPFGITCGVATGPAFVGPLGNASVKRHTIISNAMSEAAALERMALWYPGCNALIGGDMIPAVEGYCQYVLLDASLLPGSNGRRRRVACLKGPMVACGKDPAVVSKLLPTDCKPPEINPYRTLNEAMNAFLEGSVDVCRGLLKNVEEECAAAVAKDEGSTWESEERAVCTRTIARVISGNLNRGVDGRTYCSKLGETYATVPRSLCFFLS